MMTTRLNLHNKNIKTIFVFLLLLSVNLKCFSQDDGKWTVGAVKFYIAKGQSADSVIESMSSELPAAILSRIGHLLERNIKIDEVYERKIQEVNEQLISLALQLSAEIKKRDSLVLGNFTEGQLKSKIREEDKKIKEIHDKINAALIEKQELIEKSQIEIEEAMYKNSSDLTEGEKWLNLISHFFIKKDALYSSENIVFYREDPSSLYSSDYTDLSSAAFARRAYSENINALISGEISVLNDFFSVSIKVYSYPSGKVIGELVEVGLISDYESVVASAAQKIIPFLTNSIPLLLNVKITPPQKTLQTEQLEGEIAETVEAEPAKLDDITVFIDDIIVDYKSPVTLDSGVHTILVSSEKYKTLSTTYFFEGNTLYDAEFTLEDLEENFLKISTKKGNEGRFLLNGIEIFNEELSSSVTGNITINGKNILGQFVNSDGASAFFYIPEKLTYNGSSVTINPKIFDRDEYIDTRRKIMYASYSLFILSLIPTFYNYGNYLNQVKLYNKGVVEYSTAVRAQNTLIICQGISIGCAVFWGYELFRYLLAANSVLPQKAVMEK